PQRPAHLLRGVLDHADRHRQPVLDRLATRAVPGDQPSRGAVVDLADEHRAYLGILGALHLTPHLAVRVAEARKRTQRLRVAQCHRRSLEQLRLLAIGRAARRLRAVEADLVVRAVAEGLVMRVPAATERVAGLRGERIALAPLLGAALG